MRATLKSSYNKLKKELGNARDQLVEKSHKMLAMQTELDQLRAQHFAHLAQLAQLGPIRWDLDDNDPVLTILRKVWKIISQCYDSH